MRRDIPPRNDSLLCLHGGNIDSRSMPGEIFRLYMATSVVRILVRDSPRIGCRMRTVPTEHAEQCAVVNWWIEQYPKWHLLLTASANGAHIAGSERVKAMKGADLVASGVLKGEPDIFIAVPRGGYHGLYIEMKKSNATPSKVRAEQWDIIEARREAGYYADWAAGADEAIEIIKGYLKL